MKKFLRKMADILVNGVDFKANHSIRIVNNRIYIDGKEVTPDSKNITISVQGDVDELNIDSCGSLKVNGKVETLKSGSSDIDIVGDVTSVISASGDIDIKGNVLRSVSSASGDIEVRGHIYGKVSTMSGDVDCDCRG